MKAILTCDWHFSDQARDSYRFEFVDWLRLLIKSESIDVVFVLGDLTEQKDRHTASFVNKVVDVFARLQKLCPVVFMRGNHDGPPGYCFFEFLGLLERVDYIGAPISTPFLSKGRSRLKLGPLLSANFPPCLFVPHTRDVRTFAGFENCNYLLMFAHNSFNGAKLSDTQTLSDAFELSILRSVAKKVYSGDIHIPQDVGALTYVGAPYHVDFGDDYQGRVLIMDGRGRVVPKVYEGRQKRLVTIAHTSDLKRTKLNEGDIVKVRVTGKSRLFDAERMLLIQKKCARIAEDQSFHLHNVEFALSSEVASGDNRTIASVAKNDVETVDAFCKVSNCSVKTASVGVRITRGLK